MQLKNILCLVTDRRNFTDDELLNRIEKAIQGGVNMVQFREKILSDDAFLSLALKILHITKKYNIPLIINNRVEIAKKLDVSLHFGKSDYNHTIAQFLHEKRPNQIIGYSIDTIDDLNENAAIPTNIDYLGVGAIWASKTKQDAKQLGLEGLQILANGFNNYPIIAIGGIVLENLQDIFLSENIVGVALIGALLDAPDIYKAAQNFSQLITHKIAKN